MSGFKSKAQRTKFQKMLKEGLIDQKTFDTMERGTKTLLPSRMTWPKVKQSEKPKVLRAMKVPRK